MRELSAARLGAAIREKKYSVKETVTAYIDHIEKSGNPYNSFITLTTEHALARADAVQTQINAGTYPSPLAGVPVAIKDNIVTNGITTTCASKMLSNFSPVYNAAVIEKLEQAGMIIIGKLNMDEYAMGGSGETSVFGAIRNPWDTGRVAGGSSSGSAAAVAAREVPIALGSDTGGSIRQPAAFCGVTGIKPTYGAVSRYGLIAYASSLDQIGTLTVDIEDAAALLSIISGPDKRDSTCIINNPFDFNAAEPSGSIKIGLPVNYLENGIDEDVKRGVITAADDFKKAGAQIEEFEMPLMEYMIPAYYIIACAEASSNLSRYDGLKYGYRSENGASLSEVIRHSRSEGFGMEVKRRIMLGSFVLSSGYFDAYYKKALQTRALIKEAYDKLFNRFDIILSPVAPTTAYKIGENIQDPMKMYMGDIYTVSVNLAGLPAVSLPCGFDGGGLPIGFQLIGPAFSENTLINAARLYQRRTDYHLQTPGGVGL